MNQNDNATTLTMFHLDHFLDELERRGISIVRCEAGTRDIPSKQAGPWRQYKVVLTALDAEGKDVQGLPVVIVCSVLTGEGWAMFTKDGPHADNLDRAKEIVVQHLSDKGYQVLPGMYHHREDGLAVAKRLWRFDDSKRLVPLGGKSNEVISLECRNPRCHWQGTSEEAPYYSELDEYGCPDCGGFDLRIAETPGAVVPSPDCEDCPEAESCKDLCLRDRDQLNRHINP
jgi:hypothetical protein